MTPGPSEQRIERLDTQDIPRVRARLQSLEEVEMNSEDIDPDRPMFWGIENGNTLRAFVRLEVDGQNGLMASLFVEPDNRGMGVGQRLVRHVEEKARDHGVDRLFLFSTDAGAFYEALGYYEIPVKETIEAVRNTPQVEWYRDHPALLAKEITFVKALDEPVESE